MNGKCCHLETLIQEFNTIFYQLNGRIKRLEKKNGQLLSDAQKWNQHLKECKLSEKRDHFP